MMFLKRFSSLSLLPILFFSSCLNVPSIGGPEAVPEEKTGHTIPGPPEPAAGLQQEYYVTIIAAGDNLFHNTMIRDGEQGDYESIYSEIRHIVKPADIAFINQETVLAGEEFGFSGYPQFNTPQKVGQAVTAAGFSVVNHATNHIMDKGERAVFATMDFWDTVPGVTVLGIHRSQEQRDVPRLIEKNSITMGFLSYTYGTNGLPVPSGRPYLVSLINTEIMAKEINALRPLCDFLIVSMHWGEEYRNDYSRNQERLAAFLAEHRVDLVIGHHPHVLQPVEYTQRPDGGTMLCFYSLGNLVSSQSQNPTMLGALAYARIQKTPNGIVFADAGAVPLVTHYEKNHTNFTIYPLYAYTEELADRHWINREKKELTTDYLTGLASRVLGDKEIAYDPFGGRGLGN